MISFSSTCTWSCVLEAVLSMFRDATVSWMLRLGDVVVFCLCCNPNDDMTFLRQWLSSSPSSTPSPVDKKCDDLLLHLTSKVSTKSRVPVAQQPRFSHTELQVGRLLAQSSRSHHRIVLIHHTPGLHTRQPAPTSIPLRTPSHSATMTSTIGIPIKLLNESTVSEIAKCLPRPALCLQELSQLTRDATGPPSHG
jgi:hypothetical protein